MDNKPRDILSENRKEKEPRVSPELMGAAALMSILITIGAIKKGCDLPASLEADLAENMYKVSNSESFKKISREITDENWSFEAGDFEEILGSFQGKVVMEDDQESFGDAYKFIDSSPGVAIYDRSIVGNCKVDVSNINSSQYGVEHCSAGEIGGTEEVKIYSLNEESETLDNKEETYLATGDNYKDAVNQLIREATNSNLSKKIGDKVKSVVHYEEGKVFTKRKSEKAIIVKDVSTKELEGGQVEVRAQIVEIDKDELK